MTAACEPVHAEPCPVTVSLFRGARNHWVESETTGSWAQFVRDLPALCNQIYRAPVDDSKAASKAAKERMRAIVCAAFDGGYGIADNVGEHSALVLDVDRGASDLPALIARCAALRCVMYESPSSTADHPKLRIIAAVPEPVPPHAVPAARLALAEELGVEVDKNTLYPSCIFFAGRFAGTPERKVWTFDGEVWTPPPPGDAPPEQEASAAGASEPLYDANHVPDLSALALLLEPEDPDRPASDLNPYRSKRPLVRGLAGTMAKEGVHPDAIYESVFALHDGRSRDPGARAELARETAEEWYRTGASNIAGAGAVHKHFAELVENPDDVVAHIREQCLGSWERKAADVWTQYIAERRAANDVAADSDVAESTTAVPIDYLPPWIRDHVKAVRESLRLPLAVHVAYALGALSCALQGRVKVRVKRGWVEQTNLLVCVVADSGAGKSPAFNAAIDPITNWEKQKRAEGREAYVEAKTQRELYAARKSNITASLKKGFGDDWKTYADGSGNDGAELLKICLELDKPEPVEFRYVVSDATPAATAKLLALHGRLAVLNDDADGVFQILAGKYNEGVADIDLWLHAYNGKFMPVDRVARDTPEPRHEETTLAAVLSLQPDRFRVHAKNAHFAGQGLTQRITWIKAPATGVRYGDDEDEPEIPEAIELAYDAMLAALLESGPRELRLSTEAHAERKRWRQELDNRSRGPKADLADIRGWVSKHQGRTLRIAGLLHVASGAEGNDISGATMRAAVAFGHWLLEDAHNALVGNTAGVLQDDLEDRLLELVTAGHRKLGKLQPRITPGQRAQVPAALERLVEQGRLALDAEGYRVTADGADGR